MLKISPTIIMYDFQTKKIFYLPLLDMYFTTQRSLKVKNNENLSKNPIRTPFTENINKITFVQNLILIAV